MSERFVRNLSFDDVRQLETLVLRCVSGSEFTLDEHNKYRKLVSAFIASDIGHSIAGAIRLNIDPNIMAQSWNLEPLSIRTSRISTAFRLAKDDAVAVATGDPARHVSVFAEQNVVEEKPFSEKNEFKSSEWTGIPSARERQALIYSIVPRALSALDQLVSELESDVFPSNGGPPIDDIQEHIKILKELRDSLINLIDWAEHGASGSLPVIVNARRYFMTLRSSCTENSTAYAVGGVVAVLTSALGWGEPGAWLAGALTTVRGRDN
jgi:hypothetical protein